MKHSFFKALSVVLCRGFKPKAGKQPPDLGQVHRKLKRDKRLQPLAQKHGNRRRLEQWLVSVQDGYREKENLVALKRGHNTTQGIPA